VGGAAGGAVGAAAGEAGWFRAAEELRAADGSAVLSPGPVVVGAPGLSLAS